MSRIRFGPAIEDIRGSTGPLTFSRNLSSHYLAQRRHKNPPLTTAATAARLNFSSATAAWKALTPQQRSDWNDFAANPPETEYDPWSNQTYRSGFTWFVRIFTRCLSVSETPPSAPPPDQPKSEPWMIDAIIAPAGSANNASYITFYAPYTNLIPNGECEPPYTSGLADQWVNLNPTRTTPTQESIDVFHNIASQKLVTVPGTYNAIVRTAYFTPTTHPGYWLSLSYKALDSTYDYIAFYNANGTFISLVWPPNQTQWTTYYTTFTPPAAVQSYIYIRLGPTGAASILLDDFILTAPEYFILTASIAPSPGRQTPSHSPVLIHASYSDTPDTLYIGDALNAAFGAYPAGWTIFFTLRRQSISGLRSPAYSFTATTG